MAGGVDRFDLQPAKCQNLPIGQPMVGGKGGINPFTAAAQPLAEPALAPA